MNAALQHRPGTRALPAVEAELNFLAPDSPHPVSYTFQPPEGVPWTTARTEPRRVAIHDGRHQAEFGVIGLDVTGFEAIHHRSVITDIAETPDDAWIRSTYCPESVQLLRRITGRREGRDLRPHGARQCPRSPGHARSARTGQARPQRPDATGRGAARPRSPAGARGRGTARRALRHRQSLAAAGDGRAAAAGALRCPDHRAAGPRGQRPGLPRQGRRNLVVALQREPALVLVPAAAQRRGIAAEDFRFARGRHGAADGSHGVRSPRDAARRRSRRSIELRALLFWKREGAP